MNRLSRHAAAVALAMAPAAHAALDLPGIARDVEACTDLYRHANGRWLSTSTIPGDRSRRTAFEAIDERNEVLLRDVLGAAVVKRPAEGTAARKAADFYASGMDVAAVEKAGLAPLRGPGPEACRWTGEDAKRYTPPRYRVNGVVVNLPEFARAFDCDPKKSLRAENERADLW